MEGVREKEAVTTNYLPKKHTKTGCCSLTFIGSIRLKPAAEVHVSSPRRATPRHAARSPRLALACRAPRFISTTTPQPRSPARAHLASPTHPAMKNDDDVESPLLAAAADADHHDVDNSHPAAGSSFALACAVAASLTSIIYGYSNLPKSQIDPLAAAAPPWPLIAKVFLFFLVRAQIGA